MRAERQTQTGTGANDRPGTYNTSRLLCHGLLVFFIFWVTGSASVIITFFWLCRLHINVIYSATVVAGISVMQCIEQRESSAIGLLTRTYNIVKISSSPPAPATSDMDDEKLTRRRNLHSFPAAI